MSQIKSILANCDRIPAGFFHKGYGTPTYEDIRLRTSPDPSKPPSLAVGTIYVDADGYITAVCENGAHVRTIKREEFERQLELDNAKTESPDDAYARAMALID